MMTQTAMLEHQQQDWEDGQETSIDAQKMQSDDPIRLERFVKDNPVERLQGGFWAQWADMTLNSVNKTVHRIRRIYQHVSWKESACPYSRKSIRRRKVYPLQMQSFMGVEIPRNTREALSIDRKNNDTHWKVAMNKEVDGIKEHGTFLFLPPGASLPEGSVVRLDSIRLLNVIAKAQGLDVLAGDVGNAYLNAETKEKVFVICGPEFGPELEGRIAIIKKSLYGLKSSGAQWHAHFAMTLHTLGFSPTRFDNDVWIKLREDGTGYDYISTYVDDFLITAKDPWYYMKQLQEVYLIKEPKTPDIVSAPRM